MAAERVAAERVIAERVPRAELLADPGALEPGLRARYERLVALLRELGAALVAYSGGVDSAVLLRVAVGALGERARGLIAVSPSLAPWELAGARALAAEMGAPLLEVPTDELARPGYRANAGDRCYHCKAELFDVASLTAAAHGLAGALCYGAITDDLGDHRPGMQAARDRGARAPLLEAGLSKSDVRALARAFGLSVWDKPAAACLSSRFPRGVEVTAERLAQVGRCEARLMALGLRVVRARYHGELVRLELGEEEQARVLASAPLRAEVTAACRAEGFRFSALDLEGYRSGSGSGGGEPALVRIGG